MATSRNEYLKTLNKMRDNYQNNGNAMINTLDDSTSVGEELSSFAYMDTKIPSIPSSSNENLASVKEERNGWQRSLDTVEDTMSNISRGVFNFFDSIGDFLIGTAGEIGSWFGADTEWAENAIKYDWVSQANEALSVLNVYDVLSGDVFTEDYWSDYANVFSSPEQAQFRAEKRRQGSFVSDASEKFQSGFKNVTEGIGELLPSLAVAAVTGGSSLGAQAAIQGGIAVAKSGGQSMESALNEGANFHGAVKYGAVKGTISGIITAATVGIGGSVLSQSGSGIVSKASGKVGEMVGNAFSNSATAEVVASKATEILMRAGIDATSAGAQTLLEPVLKQITYDNEAVQKAYGSDEAVQNTMANMGYAMVQAGITSAIVSTAKEVASGASAGSFEKYKENYFVNKETRGDYLKQRSYKKEYDKLCEEYYSKSGLKNGNLVSKEEFIKLSEEYSSKIMNLEGKYNVNKLLENTTQKDYTGTTAQPYQNAINEAKSSIHSEVTARAVNNNLPKAIALSYIQKSGWKAENSATTSNGNTSYISQNGNLKLTYNEGTGQGTVQVTNEPNTSLPVVTYNNETALQVTSSNQLPLLGTIIQYGDKQLPSTIIINNKDISDEPLVIKTNDITQADLQKQIGGLSLENFVNKNIDKFDLLPYNEDTRKVEVTNEHGRIETTIEDGTRQLSINQINPQRYGEESQGLRTIFERERSSSGHSSGLDVVTSSSGHNYITGISGKTFYDYFSELHKQSDAATRVIVDLHDIKYYDLSKGQTFIRYDGKAVGFVEKTGNIISVLNADSTVKGFVKDFLAYAVKNKGRYMDSMNSLIGKVNLPYTYSRNGFMPVAKIKYNRDIMLEGHTQEEVDAFEKKYGECDIIFSAYTGKNEPLYDSPIAMQEEISKLKYVDWNEAEKIRDNYLKNGGVASPKNHDANLVKDSANLNKDRVYTLTKTEEIVKNAITGLKDKLGKGFDIKLPGKKDDVVRKAFEDINLKDVDSTVNNLLTTIKNATVYYNKGTEDEVSSKLYEIATEKQIEDLEKSIRNLIESKGSISAYKKFQERIERIKNELANYRKRTELLIESIKTLNALKNKFENTKSMTFTGDVPVEEINLYSSFIKGIKLSQTAKGISPKSIDHLVANFNEYTMENFGESVIGFNTDLKALVDSFKETFVDGEFPNRALTLDETKAFNNIMKMISHDVKELQSERTIKMVQSVQKVHKQTSFVHKNVSRRNYNYLARLKDGAMGAPAYIANYLGQNNDFYKLITEEWREADNNEIRAYNSFIKVTNNDIPKALGISKGELKKGLNKKISFTKNGKTEKLSVNKILDIYCSFKTAKEESIANGFALSNEKKGTVVRYKFTEEEILDLYNQIPEDMRNYCDKVFDDVLNKMATDYLVEKYKDHTGLTIETHEQYYPKSILGSNNQGLESLNSYDKGFLTTNNMGFLKKRTTNKAPILIKDFTAVINNYFNKLSFYGEKTNFIDKYRVYMNKKVDGTNINELFSESLPGWKAMGKDEGWSNYLTKVILGKPIVKNQGGIIEGLYQNGVNAILGANVSSSLKQLLSDFTYASAVGNGTWCKTLVGGIKNIARGKKISSILEENSPYFVKRWNSNEVIKSETGAQKISGAMKVFGWAMEYLDKKIITSHGWSIAQYLAKQQGGGEYWSETNNALASKILTELVLKTQSNSDPMYTSRLRSGDLGALKKELFGIFGSDNQNKAQLLNQMAIEKYNADKRIKAYEEALKDENITPEDKEFFEEEIKQEKEIYQGKNYRKGLFGVITSLFMSALGATAITMLNDRLKGKKEWNEFEATEFANDVILNATVNWMPYIGTIANAIENNSDVSLFTTDRINDIIDLFKDSADAFTSGDKNKVMKALKNISIKLAELTGFPASNLYNYLTGIWYNIDKESATKFKSISNGYSSTYMKTQYSQSITDGQTQKAEATLKAWSSMYSINLSDAEASEIVRLDELGYSTSPKSILASYNDEKGNTLELSQSSQKEFVSYYSEASKEAKAMMELTTYKQSSDEAKAKAIKKIYDSYYNYSKYKVTKVSDTSKTTKLLNSTNGQLGLSKYVIGVNALSDITATKDNTRKELVLKEINKMSGFNKTEKLILAYLCGYSLSDKNKSLVEAYLLRNGGTKNSVKIFEANED